MKHGKQGGRRGTIALTKGNNSKLFKPTENYQELLDGLRDAYLAYKESAGRRKPVLKPRKAPGAGSAMQSGTPNITDVREEQQFRDFYFAAPIPLLEEPEKQKKFRAEYLADVGARPEPEPSQYMADALHLDALKKSANHAKPSIAREDLAAFFRRHSVYLQHKKYRMLGRWSNQITSSEKDDKSADHFGKMIGRLQKELDSAMQRTERLACDDAYDYAIDPEGKRPQPTSAEADGGRPGTLLYVEAPDKSINSAIRLDDIEVFLRVQTYRARLFRLPEKLSTSIRWLSYTRRFDIWERSRLLMHGGENNRSNRTRQDDDVSDDRQGRRQKREDLWNAMDEFARNQLRQLGVAEDKELNRMAEKYTRHLQIVQFMGYQAQALQGNRADEEKPPFLCTSNRELSHYLYPLASEFGLQLADVGGQDGGAQAAYHVDTHFPTRFQQQAFALQFDGIDSGELSQVDTDILLIQKLTQELNLSKNDMLSQMAQHAEIERKKSILGQISNKEQLQVDGDSANQKKKDENGQTQAEDIARANLVRRIKEMEFFTLDETQCKLKKADWLQYVCWLPTIDNAIQRQNHRLSKLEDNPIDSLLLSAFEFVDVNENGAANKILADSASAHVNKVKNYFTEVSRQQEREPRTDPNDTVEQMMKKAALGENSNKVIEASRTLELGKGQAFIEKHLQAIDPLKAHLIKSYYALRLLKQRNIKAQLIQAMNYFRAVQKRLAFDVREFFTRDRALGGQDVEDALIGPQFGKDENGNLKAKQGGSSGPGNINATRLNRPMDDGSHLNLVNGEPRSDTVSLKGYKYNKKFNPRLISTCPCVPRFHTTFGRPTLYEEISESIQKRETFENIKHGWRFEASSIPGGHDKIIFVEGQKSIIDCEFMVRDEHGIQIVYEEALNDMLLLEEELIKIGSFFLNKAEMSMHACAGEEQTSMLDRGEITLHLLQHELEFQAMKAKYIESLLEAYNHVCDPLESVRIIQMIVDTMALRPRIDLDAQYFRDSFIAEREVLRQKQLLFSEMLDFLKRQERHANDNARKAQELKVRKLIDFVQGKWNYRESQIKKVERMGTWEEQESGIGQEGVTEGRRAQAAREMKKREALSLIAQRHITEFAGDQHTDFAKVLGLPEVTAADLFKKQGQQDPIVIDAIREQCNFSKQTEGYPWYFTGNRYLGDATGLHTDQVGLTDFFESFCSITRIHAACQQAAGELNYVFKPENGMAAACLERALLEEGRARWRELRQRFDEGGHPNRIENNTRLEEDFYLSSSDKLIFLMRDFKHDLHPERIAKTNPLLISKLDIKEMAKFDFPRLKRQEIEGPDEQSAEKVAERMIALAKLSVTRKSQDSPHQEELFGFGNDDQAEKQIKSPSMMVMGCNLLEVIRLREELIRASHETNVLWTIYEQQLESCGKKEPKRQQPSNAFDTAMISGENVNFVDKNDGSLIDVDLTFQEFDPSLKAQLDFRSESCVKALMTEVGVEEMRAIFRYQQMQKQMLTVAVTRNQALMDGALQAQRELALFEQYKISVPGSMLPFKDLFQRGFDGPAKKLHERVSQMSQTLSKAVNKHLLSVTNLKNRHRPTAIKKWTPILQRLQGSDKSMEVKLRILRASRLAIIHEYCNDVCNDLYSESLAVQTLHNCRELRRKAALFPKDSMPLTVADSKQTDIQEHLPFALKQAIGIDGSPDAEPKPSVGALLGGAPKTILYVPSSQEIMDRSSQAQSSLQTYSVLSRFDEEKIDSIVGDMNPIPSYYTPQEEKQQPKGRLVNFKESITFTNQQTELLQYSTIILQIVSIEYYMGRNHSPGTQVLELEENVESGKSPWQIDPSKAALEKPENSPELKNATSRVIAQIMKQRRAKVDLAEDLAAVCRRLKQVDSYIEGANSEQLRMTSLLELLRLQHQASYLQMVNGLENAIDIYLDHNSQDNFAKVLQVHAALSRRDHGFNLLGNGYYLNQGSRDARDIDASVPLLADDDEFLKCYQPIIDETALIPSQLTLVRKLYGRESRHKTKLHASSLNLALPNYWGLSGSFLNMDDEQRSFLATNFHQLDEGLEEYLIFEELIEDKSLSGTTSDEKGRQDRIHVARPREILQGKIDYLSLKVEARHLQRIYMSWTICKALPDHIEEYKKAQKLCREQTMLKVLLERDQLIDQYNQTNPHYRESQGDKGSVSGGGSQKLKQEYNTALESVATQPRAHPVVSRLSQIKAEISVAGRAIDIEMIKMSREVIDREQSALLAAFDQGGAEERVQYFVHPQQQFASTLFQSVDKNSHLDVVNKLGFVQTFLTKLRNRCTEVETLAGGPGIVFSLNDFNECLHAFCQSLLKYSEAELRTRVETQHIRENQYQHLLYMKEKQALYFRRKCEQFLDNIDKLVNAKISQKGSQLIYELDVASRELRVLKDNYRLMRGLMMRELRHEYIRAIQEEQQRNTNLRIDYVDHKDRVGEEVCAEVEKAFGELAERAKKAAKGDLGFDLHDPLAQGSRGRSDARDSINGDRQMPVFDDEPRRELLQLQKFIQKRRVFTMMRQVIADERHEKEQANQRSQLTSNAALWDQLAEAEKREQITKQELSLTKLSLASYEKLIEKLQGELENLNNQKARLQQYKVSKSKRIEELENKMKDLEILENIDLNRILTELKSRDRKIEQLSAIDKAGSGSALHAVRMQGKKEVQDLKDRLNKEREMKLQAYDRLEGLRVEMRALEGKDTKSDLWKDKCRELFEICKELEQENEDLRSLVGDANRANLLRTAEASHQAAIYHQGYFGDGAGSTAGSIGAYSANNPPIKSGERLFTSRTLGAIGQAQRARGLGRLASGSGPPNIPIMGKSPMTNQPATLAVDGQSSMIPKRKGGGGQPSGWQNKETVHSDNIYSYNISGVAGGGPLGATGTNYPMNLPPGTQEVLSLNSGRMIGGHSMASGLDGERRSVANPMGGGGGVFSGTLQSTQPPRSIMTAQGGTRSTNRAYGGGPRGRQNGQAANGTTSDKRGFGSQQPQVGFPGVRQTMPMHSKTIGTSSGRQNANLGAFVAGPNAGAMNLRPGSLYQSHNQGITGAGLNIQGRSGISNHQPQPSGAQRVSNIGPHSSDTFPGSHQQQQQQHPVSFNINFNTTNINMQ